MWIDGYIFVCRYYEHRIGTRKLNIWNVNSKLKFYSICHLLKREVKWKFKWAICEAFNPCRTERGGEGYFYVWCFKEQSKEQPLFVQINNYNTSQLYKITLNFTKSVQVYSLRPPKGILIFVFLSASYFIILSYFLLLFIIFHLSSHFLQLQIPK